MKLEIIFSLLSKLGGTTFCSIVFIYLFLYLAIKYKKSRILWIGLFPLTGLVLAVFSKLIFYAYGVGLEYNFTGISGHAFRSAFLYPLLAYSIFNKTSKLYFFCSIIIASLLSFSIGFVRYYHGYHTWLELFGGFILGGFISCLSIKSLHQLISEDFLLSRSFYMLGTVVVLGALLMGDVSTVSWLRDMATWLTGEPIYRR